MKLYKYTIMSTSNKRKIFKKIDDSKISLCKKKCDEPLETSKYFADIKPHNISEEKDNFSSNHHTQNSHPEKTFDIAYQLLSCVDELNIALKNMTFLSPVKYVYNPAEYAYDTYKDYIQKYGNAHKSILFLGMNPGPWGMSQTGVPFGEIPAVKNWLKITGTIGKPAIEAPERPVLGFECPRSEVSGKRFWGLAEFLSKTPEKFFQNCFVYNYCPLQFIGAGSKNVTPAELKIQEREHLFKVCDEELVKVIKILNSRILVGIGVFAEKRFKEVIKANNLTDVKVYVIPHPSPRAAGNHNWQEKAINQLKHLDLLEYFTE